MYDRLEDTIVAIASAPGAAARGIVRLSGPDCLDLFKACWQPTSVTSQKRFSYVEAGELTLPELIAPLPAEAYIWPTSKSYTRQPMIELHLLGSPPLLRMVVRRLCQLGARSAQRGEFTLRAFLGGRLDLTQAEAVLGVIDAVGENELAQALDQLAGGLRKQMQQVRESLLDLLVHLEAGLDFVEEDIEFITVESLTQQIEDALQTLTRLAEQQTQRSDLSELPKVVLYGLPNVGKSSLFNALIATTQSATNSHQALVSEVAGTTRDYLTATVRWGETTLQLIDTAGKEGLSVGPLATAQTQAAEQLEQARLRLLCLDASRTLEPWEEEQLAIDDPLKVVLYHKADLPLAIAIPPEAWSGAAIEGDGIEALKALILEQLQSTQSHEEGMVTSTAVRCEESLTAAIDSLQQALEIAAMGNAEELVAAELRSALDGLGQIVGAVYTDDILDRVFQRFCIGK
ncbi:tRNA modification GTPase MnmE [Planctomycetales bacterium 10988]|nr:tRNA modification GTPase MnmE [Planctomycetales bacterium 10988]